MAHRVTGRVLARSIAALLVTFAVLGPRATAPAYAASTTVHIGDALDPASVTITPGSTVTWVNDSGNRHRLRSTSGPVEFDSGDLDAGATFTFTFAAVGTWQYRDERNKDLSNYWGTVTVSSAPTPGPTLAPTLPPGATPPPATSTPPSPPGDILMAGRAFSPPTLTVDAGTLVRWRNNDGREHTVTANDRSFDSGLMPVGATFVRTFSVPGTYAYICAIHPDMTGTIAVRATGGGTPPPPPPPTPAPTLRPTLPPGATPAPGTGEVRAVDFAFTPSSLDVAAGTTVTWLNDGAALHTVTASDGSWDSGLIASGRTFSRRFGTPGTYLYLCFLHPSMTGVVRVSGANGATPPPPPPPTPRPGAPTAGSGEYELRDFAFVPSAIRVAPGTTVTWLNTGAAPHTVTDRAGTFDSGILNRGVRWSRTFSSPGTFQLLCTIHPEMHATLVVAAPGTSAPPPATAAPVATPAPGSGEVAILDFDFAPAVVQVPVGTTVKWINQGVAPHTVTAKDGSFDSGFLANKEAYTRQFPSEGTFEYLCAIHPAMVGTVVVGSAPPPSAGAGSPSPGAAQGSPEPGASAAPATGGVTGPVAGSGSSGGTGATPGLPIPELPPGPLSMESILRLALVALIGAGAVTVFLVLMRSTMRRA
jgi:plastocyanin